MTALLLTVAVVVIGAVMLLVAMVGGVWWQQERIAYQPPAESPTAPSGARRVEYTADDGQPLYGYRFDPAGTPRGVLLAFHGNADLATWQIAWGQELARRTGWCVLLAEYRGYGGLSGAPTYVGVQRDARAAWRMAHAIASTTSIASHDATPLIAVYGHSLGSAVAIELAAEVLGAQPESVTAVLLQSPFTSAREWRASCPRVPFRCFGSSSRVCTTTLVPGSTRSTCRSGSHTANATGSCRWRWDASCSREHAYPVSCSSFETPGTTTLVTSAVTRTGGRSPMRSWCVTGIPRAPDRNRNA